jgi:hypothetical protein
MARSIAEIETDIETWSAKLDGLADVPTRGAVGRTQIDLSNNPEMIERKLARLRLELQAARSPDGIARRQSWGGCCR